MIFFIAHTRRYPNRTSIGTVKELTEVDQSYIVDHIQNFDTPREAYDFLVAVRDRLAQLNYVATADSWNLTYIKCITIVNDVYGEFYG